MITLNTEKGVVRIELWSDITDRPDYRARIDPEQSKLKEVIGAYEFPEKVNCGLPCNQPHNRGYLVSTKDGLVTNIGGDCGKATFDIEWEQAKRTYEKLDRHFRLVEAVLDIKKRLPEIRARVDAIKALGATWVYERILDLRTPNRAVPKRVVDVVDRMVRSGSPNVTITRQLTDSEREAIDAASARPAQDEKDDDDVGRKKKLSAPRFTEEVVGSIQGLAALGHDRNLRKLLVEDVDEMWRVANAIDDQTASTRQLGDVAKWGGNIDASLALAEETVRLSKILLTGTNLRILLRTVETNSDNSQFRQFLAQLPNQ